MRPFSGTVQHGMQPRVTPPHRAPNPTARCLYLQVGILLKGMEGIRVLEAYSAPVLMALTAALLVWAVRAAGGFGPMLAAPSQFAPGMPQAGRFWAVFLPALSAQIGYWCAWCPGPRLWVAAGARPHAGAGPGAPAHRPPHLLPRHARCCARRAGPPWRSTSPTSRGEAGRQCRERSSDPVQ